MEYAVKCKTIRKTANLDTKNNSQEIILDRIMASKILRKLRSK